LERSGKVFLVGAGPGDPGLITVRGVQCLAQAEIVLYDYLVNSRILEHAPPETELVCLGRHGHGRLMSQQEICDRLIAEAKAGRQVVRLKGGDPAVFAREAEELEALAAARIDVEIVPGITAALAVSSFAGVPLTHRDMASAVALVTGQERADKDGSAIDWEALARFPGTLVVYMGVTTAPHWSAVLLAAGKPQQTPVAIIRRCSFPDQQVTRCTLGDVSEVLGPGKMRPPVLVIVGEVVGLGQRFNWFTKRSLFGCTVLVTRPENAASDMRAKLEAQGAAVLVQPAIEITDPSDWRPVDDSIANLGDFDWIVFSSASGVRYYLNRILSTGRDMRCLGSTKIACIGPATAEALAKYQLKTDLEPEEYRAESLAESLKGDAAGSNILLVRASRGREVLREELEAAGATVTQVVTYTSGDVPVADDEIQQAMRAGEIEWTTVTRSAIARSLVAMFGDDLRQTKLIAISPITSGVLRELGFEPAAEAAVYTTDGMIETLIAER